MTGALLNEVDPRVTAGGLALLMLASWAAGWWSQRRLPKERRSEPADKFIDASMALLGLLLAFSFSLALTKHEQRRQMVVTDSNSVGDFYTAASLVKEPVRGKLRAVVREYVEHRVALARGNPTPAEFEKRLSEIGEMHGRMQDLVGEAIDGQTPVVVPLVNTLNEVTSSHAARLAAARDRLPPSIVAVLFLAAVVSMLLTGARQGATGENHVGAPLAFAVLVCMTVMVTLDLNQPLRGMITVSQEPMERLLAGMGQ